MVDEFVAVEDDGGACNFLEVSFNVIIQLIRKCWFEMARKNKKARAPNRLEMRF